MFPIIQMTQKERKELVKKLTETALSKDQSKDQGCEAVDALAELKETKATLKIALEAKDARIRGHATQGLNGHIYELREFIEKTREPRLKELANSFIAEMKTKKI
ncbi:MAG: hypothetical protein ABII22_01560 [Candidatus Micrarchaeota archaeon]